jgi:predicted RNA-binding protein with PIN domain
MPTIIDGHNLIPKVRGLSLQRLDDEMELIQRLQTYCRVRRKTIEVYFDRGAPGRQGTRSFGAVKAHFVTERSNADSAIRQALHKLGRKARNWEVVSSDRQVQAEARAAGAVVIPSEEFAAQLEDTLLQAVKSGGESQDISPEEVDRWLDEFNEGKRDQEK